MGDAPILRSLEALPRARVLPGGGWTACCPAHPDAHPSLGWRLGDERQVLLICRVGCRTEDVVDVMNHTMEDLYPTDDERPERPAGGGVVITDYEIRDDAGTIRAIHRRYDHRDRPKSFAWMDALGRPGLDGAAMSDLPLYGSDLVPEWDDSRPVILTEGEKACDAVRASGRRAVSTTGASVVPSRERLAILAGHDVILSSDNDAPGLRHMAQIADDLIDIARSIRWLDPAGWPVKGDLADALAPGSCARELHDMATSGVSLDVDAAVLADVNRRIGPVPDGGHGGTDEHDGGTSAHTHATPEPDPDDEDWVAAYGDAIELPDGVRPEAFHGPIGAFAIRVGGVNTIASPVSLLATGLAAFGALCGRGSWRVWNEAVTYPGLFILVVGATGDGKGLSLRITRRWLERVDAFDAPMVVSDFTSGEGLIQKLVKLEPDAIAGDTRALAWCEEFAAILRVKSREGNTLGQVLRRAYDGDMLERNTVKPSGRVDEPALSMICHITPEELRSEATALDAASGFLNRFLVLPLRSVDLHRPPMAEDEVYSELAAILSRAVAIARSHRNPVLVSPEASLLLERLDDWRQVARRRPGLIGRMLERVAQNVGRLSLAYGLSRLEAGVVTPEIEEADVLAALALGDLSERTVLTMWGSTPPDAESARLLHRVRLAGAPGISPRDLLKSLYSSSNRHRGRDLVARSLISGLLRKSRSGRGWRLHAGGVEADATLWDSVVRDNDASPIVRDRSPMSPDEGRDAA